MRHLGYFWQNYKHYFGTASPLSMGKCSWFSFLQKLWFLGLKHTTCKYSQNKIWAVKNLGNNVHTSVFGAVNNASEVVSPICLPKPKSSGFQWKKASLDVHSPCLMLSNKSRCVEIAVIITFSVLVHYTTEVSKCSGNKNICTCLIANTHEKNSIQE